MPHSSVWWVSALRSSRSAGSSSRSRCSALASLSSSPFDFAPGSPSRAPGSGASNGVDRRGRRRARRGRRRWWYRSSLATAAMSPAGDLRDRFLLLAPHDRDLVQPLVGHGAAVHEHGVGLHRALQHLEEVHPSDVGVDDRLEHERRRLPVVGLRSVGLRRRRSARAGRRRSAFVALPHSTGNTVARRDTQRERAGQLVDARSSRRRGSAP